MQSRQESFLQGQKYLQQGNQEKAIESFLVAARPKKGLFDSPPHPEACSLLGILLFSDPKEKPLAFYWLKIAETLALEKSLQSQVHLLLGVAYWDNQEYDLASKYLKGIYSWHSFWMQGMLAQSGVENPEVAEQFLLQALSLAPEKNKPSILNSLVLLYSKNYPDKLLEKLKDIDQFSSTTLYIIGMMYYQGKPLYPVEQNYHQARHYFNLATQVKDEVYPDVYAFLGFMEMYGQGNLQNPAAAEQQFRKLDSHLESKGESGTYLGIMFRFEGLGEQQDARKAAGYFKDSFLHAKADICSKMNLAKLNLAEMYANGEGVDKNPAIATALFLELFNNDKAKLMSIAECYLLGIGVIKNIKKAKLWLNIAKARGHSAAEKILALIGDDWKLRGVRKSKPDYEEQQFIEQLELCYRLTPTKLPFINEIRKINIFVATLNQTWPYGYGATNNLEIEFNQNKNRLILEGNLYSVEGINTLLKTIERITKQDSEKYNGMFKSQSVHEKFIEFSKKINLTKSTVESSSSFFSQLWGSSSSSSASSSPSPSGLASPSRAASSSSSSSASSSAASPSVPRATVLASSPLYCSGLPGDDIAGHAAKPQ